MTTKKKSDASKFLENLTGSKLTLANLLLAIRQGEEMSQVDFCKIAWNFQTVFMRHRTCQTIISPKTAAKFAKKLGYSHRQFVRLCLQDLVDRDGLKLKIDSQRCRLKRYRQTLD